MRLFVYEFVTGGGMPATETSPSLLREADLMVGALMADLAEVPGIELLTVRDPRLAPLPRVELLTPRPGESYQSAYRRGLDRSDAVWPIAPETDGVLESLAQTAVTRGTVLLGSRPDAIHIAASKKRTAAMLLRAGVPVAPAFTSATEFPLIPGSWIVKPDDGAGCGSTRRVADADQASEALLTTTGLIAQPWLEGEARSLSLLCAEGRATLLAVNRQHIDTAPDGTLSLVGLDVNAFPDPTGSLADLAARVARAIPSLWGYVGIDFVETNSGPVVLDVNPRLTTSYCGLRRAFGVNIGARVLELLHQAPRLPSQGPSGAGEVVALALEPAHER